MPGNLMLEVARAGQGVRAGRLLKLFETRREKGYHTVAPPGIPPPLKAFLTWLRRKARKS